MKTFRAILIAIASASLVGGASFAATPNLTGITHSGACAAEGDLVMVQGSGFGPADPGLKLRAKNLSGNPIFSTVLWLDSTLEAFAVAAPAGPVVVGIRDSQGNWLGNTATYLACKPSGSSVSLPVSPSKKLAIPPPPGPAPTASPKRRPKRVAPSRPTRGGFENTRPGPARSPGSISTSDLKSEILVLSRTPAGMRGSVPGARFLRRHSLTSFQLLLEVFEASSPTAAEAMVREFRRRPGVVAAAPNDRLVLLAGDASNPRSYPRALLDWKTGRSECGADTRIGMIDTAVDAGLLELRSAALVQRHFGEGAAKMDHGTAVAGLLVGRSLGLVPSAQLRIAAAVSPTRAGESKAAIEAVIRAFDWLVSEQVEVVNVSLGGAENAVLEEAVRRVLSRKITIVAAAGNGGKFANPVYPAAQSGVVAVAAVDARQRAWSGGNRGNYLDVSAPGVDVWVTRSDSEGAFVSGTSFAAPFVTAAIAAGTSADAVLADTLDLGEPGRDRTFGRGLLRAPAACRRDSVAERSGGLGPNP